METNLKGLRFSYFSLAAFALVVTSILLIDLPLSELIANYVKAFSPHIYSSEIPDLLTITVVILTALSWSAYFYLARQKINNHHKFFFCVTGIVLPFSDGIKITLKWIFGRTNTRTWLSNHGSYGFHWFAGTGDFQGFPSGHMLVLTPLFLALWHFYPRYRRYYEVIWLCLAVALIVTEYHFLSDVLAGIYTGVAIYLFVSMRLGDAS